MATLKQKHFTWLSLALLLISYIWFGWYLCGLKTPAWLNPVCHRVLEEPIPPQNELQQPEPSPEAEKTLNSAAPASPPTSAKLDFLFKQENKTEQALQSTRPALSKAIILAESSPATPHLEKEAEGAISTEPIAPSATKAEKEGSTASTSSKSNLPANNLKGRVCQAVMNYNLSAGMLALGWIVVSSLAFISPLTNFSAFLSRWFTSDTVAFATIFLVAGLATVLLYWMHIFLQITTILAVDTLARIDIQYAGLTGVQAFWILTLISFTGLIIGWTSKALI